MSAVFYGIETAYFKSRGGAACAPIVLSHLTTQPVSKYHLSHVGVVTFVNTSQSVPPFVKSALALVGNVRLRGFVRWKDYNAFAPIFHTTVGALCFAKKLAEFLMTMSHLVFSFVLLMSQPLASGFSALTGYGGRCTARTVPKETKRNSPIIIATNVSFITRGEGLMFSISHPHSTEALERSSREKAEWRFD